MSHPSDHELLLGIRSVDVRVYRWGDLLECREPVFYLHTRSVQQDEVMTSNFKVDVDIAAKLNSTSLAAPGRTLERVRATVTQVLKYILVRLSSNDSFTGCGRFFILPLSELEQIKAGFNQNDIFPVRSAAIPDDVRSRVRIALAIFLSTWIGTCG